MQTRLAVAVVSLFAAACATTLHWAKPGATAEEFNRDSYQCARQAWFRSEWAAHGAGDRLDVNKDFYRACMTARGYQRVEGGKWTGFRD